MFENTVSDVLCEDDYILDTFLDREGQAESFLPELFVSSPGWG